MTYSSPWLDDDLRALRSRHAPSWNAVAPPSRTVDGAGMRGDRESGDKRRDGLLCVSCPEEYGGGGGSFAHEAVVIEEQGRIADDGGLSVHSTIVAHYINAYATRSRRSDGCPAGGDLVGDRDDEPGTGSDLQSIATTARRHGDHFVVNGSKTFITNGTHCDLLVLVARTSDNPQAVEASPSSSSRSPTSPASSAAGLAQTRRPGHGHPRTVVHRRLRARRTTCWASWVRGSPS